MRRAALAAAAVALAGCSGARYVAQAARGQLGLLSAARPIPEVVAGREVPADTARLLLAVGEVKAFGEANGLRATASYGRYADLRRPAAVWVVQACAPLSFEVRHWRLPIVGTIPYLGFFDERAARDRAREVAEREGLDVDVRPASAYSTLGWFADPVLSTMIPRGGEALGELANVVLHESVHATLYVNDQSAFDESLASFVADRLTLAWLARAAGPDASETQAWIAAEAAHRARAARLRETYAALDALYRSPATVEEKRAGKARILEEARRALGLKRPLNNAALAGYRTYGEGGAGFERLLAACGGSWPRLLGAVRTLRPEDFGRPQRRDLEPVLDRLVAAGCPRGPPSAAAGRPGG